MGQTTAQDPHPQQRFLGGKYDDSINLGGELYPFV
jgi:hypothetical protein